MRTHKFVLQSDFTPLLNAKTVLSIGDGTCRCAFSVVGYGKQSEMKRKYPTLSIPLRIVLLY